MGRKEELMLLLPLEARGKLQRAIDSAEAGDRPAAEEATDAAALDVDFPQCDQETCRRRSGPSPSSLRCSI